MLCSTHFDYISDVSDVTDVHSMCCHQRRNLAQFKDQHETKFCLTTGTRREVAALRLPGRVSLQRISARKDNPGFSQLSLFPLKFLTNKFNFTQPRDNGVMDSALASCAVSLSSIPSICKSKITIFSCFFYPFWHKVVG